MAKSEIVEAITQLAFYAGWPKAWAAFQELLEKFPETALTPKMFLAR